MASTDRGEALALLAVVEDLLAQRGYAVVSKDVMRLVETIEQEPDHATSSDYEAALYGIFAGPLSEYWRRA